MFIAGYRDTNDTRYYIPLLVYSGHYNLYFEWNFLIDTGATTTQLNWMDAAYYGIIIRGLPRDIRTFAGLGGVVQGYLLQKSTLIFKTDIGRYDIPIGDLSVSDFQTTSGIPCPRGSSTLGIDILDKFDILFRPESDMIFLSLRTRP